MAVPSILYGMNVLNQTERELQKLEVIQHKLGRVALDASRYASVEEIREDMDGALLVKKYERLYNIYVERMPSNKWVRETQRYIGSQSKWTKSCTSTVRKCGLNCRNDRFGSGHIEGRNIVSINQEGYN